MSTTIHDVATAAQNKLSPHIGTYAYGAGTAATEAVPAGGRVIRIWALGAASGAASLSINGGDSITIPEGKEVNMIPSGSLVAPSIVFTATQSYIVEWVT